MKKNFSIILMGLMCIQIGIISAMQEPVVENEGKTPLHTAAKTGPLSDVRALIQAGDNVSALDNENNTPLHVAASEKNELLKAVKLDTLNDVVLLCKSTRFKPEDFNMHDANGETALHWATHREIASLAMFLIERGADSKAKNKEGQTPFDLLKQNDKPEHVRAVLNAVKVVPEGQHAMLTALVTAVSPQEMLSIRKKRIAEINQQYYGLFDMQGRVYGWQTERAIDVEKLMKEHVVPAIVKTRLALAKLYELKVDDAVLTQKIVTSITRMRSYPQFK